MRLNQSISGYSLVHFLYTVLYGKGVRELAGNFNKKDQFDFKLNVNGKEVSGEDGAAYAQDLINKLSGEMSGIVKKLTKNVANTVTSNGIEAIKEKVLPNSLTINSIKDLLNQEKLSKLKEKLPVIEASSEDGDVKVNVNGKSLFSLDLSNFIKK
jgi:hypothetical protein